jgi:hypothetical protein
MKDEKEKHHRGGGALLLGVLNVLALAGLAGLYLVSRSKNGKKISIEALRRAYSGLDPEEIEEMKYI